MKKMILYILLCAYLFALLDWRVVHLTRWVHPEWTDWMHRYEKTYAVLTRPAEWILCTPAMPLKPLFFHAMLYVEASGEEQESILHTPRADWRGFWNLPARGQGWVFVSWAAWFLYWLLPSLAWLLIVRRFLC